MFPGFAARLLSEVKMLYSEKFLYNKSREFVIPVNIIDSPERNFITFIGATVLVGCFKNNDSYWISRKDWEESGPDIILKKCTNILK